METFLLLTAIGAAWFWIDSIHARDIAVDAGRRAAENHGLQLLDETVAISRLRTARDSMGRLRLQRTYTFEVSDTGADRLSCTLTLLGKRVDAVEMPPYRDNVIQFPLY